MGFPKMETQIQCNTNTIIMCTYYIVCCKSHVNVYSTFPVRCKILSEKKSNTTEIKKKKLTCNIRRVTITSIASICNYNPVRVNCILYIKKRNIVIQSTVFVYRLHRVHYIYIHIFSCGKYLPLYALPEGSA